MNENTMTLDELNEIIKASIVQQETKAKQDLERQHKLVVGLMIAVCSILVLILCVVCTIMGKMSSKPSSSSPDSGYFVVNNYINSPEAAKSDMSNLGMAGEARVSNGSTVGKVVVEDNTTGVESDMSKYYLGIDGITVTKDMAEEHKIPMGIYVTGVKAKSGAEASGIKEGMVVTAIEDKEVKTVDDIKSILGEADKEMFYQVKVWMNTSSGEKTKTLLVHSTKGEDTK